MSTTLMGLCWPLQMPPTPKSVLISLADNANDQGYCWPSIARISERTCFSKRAVIDAIAWLEQSGILAADRTNGRHTTYVITPSDFVKPVQLAHQCGKSTGAASASEPVHLPHQPVHLPHQPVQQLHTNRKEPSSTVTRSNRQKGAPVIAIDLPDWLPAEAWAHWLEHRRSIRKPMSERAAHLSINALADLRTRGFDPTMVIDNAILCGWVGIYEPKASAPSKGQERAPAGSRQQQLEQRNEQVGNDWLADG